MKRSSAFCLFLILIAIACAINPVTGKRIQNVKALLGENDVAFPVRRDVYLNHINDIVYGDDPHQGFVEGNAFYHPAMGFIFDVPRGWKVENTPAQVTMAPEKGDAAIVLRAEQSRDDLRTFAQRKAAAIDGGAA